METKLRREPTGDGSRGDHCNSRNPKKRRVPAALKVPSSEFPVPSLSTHRSLGVDDQLDAQIAVAAGLGGV